MIDLVVSGATGRMGRALGELIGDADDLRSVGGIAPSSTEDAATIGYPEIVDVDGAGAMLDAADAVIDFSAPEQLAALLDAHRGVLSGRAVLVGTTGLGDNATRGLESLAEDAAVLVASNFSVGVNLLLGLVEQAARALPEAGYDIEIVEAHHRRKEDAPSGTALSLGEAAVRGRGGSLDDVRRDGRSGRTGARPPGEIGLHAVRGGGAAGEHTVRFLGTGEEVRLGHTAYSRQLFAEGALVAARWLAGKAPGRYTMNQVLGLD